MNNYYYLSSQLPILQFGRKPDIDSGWFRHEAGKWVVPQEYIILSGIKLGNFVVEVSDPFLLREYKTFEYRLRSELALYRQARKNDCHYKSIYLPMSLLAESNPLEIEKSLLHLRWQYIEEKAQVHYFDVDFLAAYLLKLLILERLLSFNKDKGTEKFRKLCEVSV